MHFDYKASLDFVKKRLRSNIRLILIAAFLMMTWLGLKAFWLEPSSLVVSKTEITLPYWPAKCDDLKVVVLADLHVGSPFNGLDNLAKVVKLTNQIDADLILLAGDYVIHEVIGGEFVEPELIARELKKLKAKLGVFAIMGNHDWWHSASQIQRVMDDEGIRLLENRATKLNKKGCNFWLAGISDYWGGHYHIDRALQDVPDTASVIVLTHNPDIFYELPQRIDITFAGHTHGGQVDLPLLGRAIVPSRYGDRLAIGHIRELGRNMFVSPGIGTSILPVRFGVPPEISTIILRSKSGNDVK